MTHRLATVEGHLGGLRRMVEGDRPCVEVLGQLHAVRNAVRAIQTRLLADHLVGLAAAGLGAWDEPRIAAELRALFGRAPGQLAQPRTSQRGPESPECRSSGTVPRAA